MELALSPIGLGTFPFSNVFSPMSADVAREVVKAHLDAGGDYVETAPIYPQAGIDLGDILQTFDRQSFKIGTKCGIAIEDGKRIISGKRDFLFRQAEAELKRLRVDKLDLLQTHVTPPDVSPSEVAHTLAMLKDEGLVSAIGVSNCSLPELKQFHEGSPIEWCQVRLSMVHRYEYEEIRDYCVDKGIKLNPFQVIERGQLLPKRDGAVRRTADLRNTKQEYTGEADKLVSSWFAELAGELSAHEELPASSLAVAWALKQPAVGCVVLGATSPEQVRMNWGATSAVVSTNAMRVVEEWFALLEARALENHGQTLRSLRGVVR